MFVHIMPVSYGLTLTFRLGSVLATLSVTLERFFAIVLPLKDVKRFKKWLIPGSIIITGNFVYTRCKYIDIHKPIFIGMKSD